MDAHLDWNHPYNADNIRGMLKGNATDDVEVIDLHAKYTKGTATSFIVESPEGVWAAWRLNTNKCAKMAIALHTDDKEKCDSLIRHQKDRMSPILDINAEDVEYVRVPGVTDIRCESAPAAIYNIKWLVSGKKRTHPGPSAYVKVRTDAYEKYMQSCFSDHKPSSSTKIE